MKLRYRLLALLLCVALCLPMASAAGAQSAEENASAAYTMAVRLQNLGLFKGTGSGFDLERTPTRVEIMVMLVRVLGKETAAKAGSYTHPFTDVASWATREIGYAYENKLVNGVSATKLDATGPTNVGQYLTLVLRALGYSDAGGLDFNWNDPYTLAREVGILNNLVDTEGFTRGDLVVISYSALGAKLKGSRQTLGEKLMDEGVFTAQQLEDNYGGTELNRALELGLGIHFGNEDQLTLSEFSKILENMIRAVDESKIPEWRALFAKAYRSDTPITRGQGMVALYYAAETLGEEYYIPKNVEDGLRIFSEIAEGEHNDFWEAMFSVSYDDFPDNVFSGTKDGNDGYGQAGYFFSMNQTSTRNGKPVFDYDAENRTMHPEAPLTYSAALTAAIRLIESTPAAAAQRPMTEADREILALADARREQILNSATDVTITGTAYYVSNDGNDNNDGLTPETAWATLKRVSDTWMEPGSGVLFRRGDVWRGETLQCKPGVTYSAYGEGPKPAIYGSPENGAGAEKWSLLEGTDNIWVFYQDMGDVGDLVLDGSMDIADRGHVWWAGDRYVRFIPLANDGTPRYETEYLMSRETFDPATDLENLRYFNEIDYSFKGTEYPIYTFYESDLRGKFYLRCDAGNPGEIYSSIEFCCDTFEGTIVWLAPDCVFENINVSYGGHAIECSEGTLVQNCEVGYMGAMTFSFDKDGTGYSGDGIMHGNNMTVQNNYVHHIFNIGIAPGELGFSITGDIPEEEIQGGNTLRGNLLEYTGGIAPINWSQELDERRMFKNMLFEDNYVLYMEASGATYDWAALTLLASLALSDEVGLMPNPLENVVIRNNIFYCADSALIFGAMPDEKYYPTFEGNTYAQYRGRVFACWKFRDGEHRWVYAWDQADLEQFVREQLGDKTGVVLGY